MDGKRAKILRNLGFDTKSTTSKIQNQAGDKKRLISEALQKIRKEIDELEILLRKEGLS